MYTEIVIGLLLCFYLTTSKCKVDESIQRISKYENLDLERQLKLLNKPAIKTIKTEFGHIVDCIDINKQLAFDNPLLKNHKLQLKPSFQDTKLNENDKITRHLKIGLGKNSCPKGSVPVRRTTKEDLIRAKLLPKHSGVLSRTMPPGYESVTYTIGKQGGNYYGITGLITVYNHIIGTEQISNSYVWLQNGLNSIDVGWQIYPLNYGDNDTHFFASWLNGDKGCYNMLCSGFIQVDKRIYLGIPLANTSTIGGTQYGVRVKLEQDSTTKNWWVKVKDTNVGYYPATLFSDMASSANKGGWAGLTFTTDGRPSPPMGSGLYPDQIDPSRVCCMRQITYKADPNGPYLGPGDNIGESYSDCPRYYNMKFVGYDNNLGYFLLFGGPGGNCDN